MALDLNLGQVIKTNIGSRFKKFVNNIGKQTLDIPSLSDFSKLSSGRPGDSAVKNLSFPLDVASEVGSGNHGHYVMFMINEQTNAKISFKGRKDNLDPMTGGLGDANASVKKENSNRAIPKFITTLTGNGYQKKANTNGHKDLLNLSATVDRSNPAEMRSATEAARLKQPIVVTRAPTRRISTAITMFMPAQVQSTYNAEYTDTGIGLITNEALEAFNSRLQTRAGRDALRRGLTEGLPTALTLLLQNTLGALPGFGGLREVQGMQTGEIISDRLELAFKGVSKRSFQYTFKMIPKSKAEAEEIRNIVFMFKSNMLPEFSDGSEQGRRMVVPNTFDIRYMYQAEENNFLHKIGTCVLENMSVSYGGDKYRTYTGIDGDGAPPVETSITLQFKELDLVTREKVQEGF